MYRRSRDFIVTLSYWCFMHMAPAALRPAALAAQEAHARRRRRCRCSPTLSRHEVRSSPYVARPRGQRVACWSPRGEQASTPRRTIGPVVVALGLAVYGRSDMNKFRLCHCRSGRHIPGESTFGRDGIGPRCPCCCCRYGSS